MAEITQNQAKILRELGLLEGNPTSAMSLFACYCNGLNGYEEDKELALKYLHYAARLCHPEALNILADLYGGKSFAGLKLEKNINEKVKYLKMLAYAENVIDFNSLNEGKDNQTFYDYEWNAYAELGRLYVMEDSLNARPLGYAISLKLAEENNMTEALFTLGYYWFYIMGERNYETSLYYFERALNNDNSFWAQQAMKFYNEIAQFANENYRGPNGQIQYYE